MSADQLESAKVIFNSMKLLSITQDKDTSLVFDFDGGVRVILERSKGGIELSLLPLTNAGNARLDEILGKESA